jgi:hypothetical protein
MFFYKIKKLLNFRKRTNDLFIKYRDTELKKILNL